MKILLITPEYPPDFGGGIVRYARDLAIALKDQGCRVSVLKGSAFLNGQDAYEQEGVPVSTLETARFEHWLGRFGHLGMFPVLRRHLSAAFALHEQVNAGEGYDVVEVTDWGLLFLPWMLKSMTRVLVSMHGSTGQIAAREPVAGHETEGMVSLLLERAGLANAHGLSASSRANRNWWESLLGRSVNYTLPPMAYPTAEVRTSVAGIHWLTVGRIQHWKGPHIACAAWQALGVDAPSLHWIGRDIDHGSSGLSTDTWLKREFPTVWRRAIQPIGQFKPEEVFQRMHDAKAVIVPSLWDTFNLAAAEAMALGKVVVISDGAGAVDLVEHGVNGFVFPNGNSFALAELVKRVESLSLNELNIIGQRAASTIREKLDPTRIASEKIQLYSSLPEPAINKRPWLMESLFHGTQSNPLAFLDGLPLKALITYVARRGLNMGLRR